MKKVAVMVPIGYRGGSLRGAKNIAKSLAYQARIHSDDLQVVFSYVKAGNYNLRVDFDDLLEEEIVLRETEWKVFPTSVLTGAAQLIDIDPSKLEFQKYCLPSDGANDFYDCDLWLIISDRLPAPLFPLRKSAFMIYDYIQRYVPEIFKDDESFWKTQVLNLMYSVQHASKVFVTTPSTRQDLISYTGVNSARIHLLDMEFQPLEPSGRKFSSNVKQGRYILWATNLAYHKNHENTLQAIEYYMQELDGSLDIVITGYGTEYFDPENEFAEEDPVLRLEQVHYVRTKLKKNQALSKRIHILGNVSDKTYAQYVQHARYLLHPALQDNGSYAVIESAYLGVPSLSSRYPAMEFINQRFELNMRFFDPRAPKELAEAMFEMESAAPLIPLPSQESLRRFDWKSLSLPLYQAVSVLLR